MSTSSTTFFSDHDHDQEHAAFLFFIIFFFLTAAMSTSWTANMTKSMPPFRAMLVAKSVLLEMSPRLRQQSGIPLPQPVRRFRVQGLGFRFRVQGLGFKKSSKVSFQC
jgi:hypothetical protein